MGNAASNWWHQLSSGNAYVAGQTTAVVASDATSVLSKMSDLKTIAADKVSSLANNLSVKLDDLRTALGTSGREVAFAGAGESESVLTTASRAAEDSKVVPNVVQANFNAVMRGADDATSVATDAEHIPEGVKTNFEDNSDSVTTRNQNLNGTTHPKTGVSFAEKNYTDINGVERSAVVPEFESKFDGQLPEDLYQASDRRQFNYMDKQLQNDYTNNPEKYSDFTDTQKEQISNGDRPEGYTWHHDIPNGKMKLVNSNTHKLTGHTGGKQLWGGGKENR